MVVLRTMKDRPKLYIKTDLSPILRQDTRWGSTYNSLVRYCKLYDILGECGFENDVLRLIPTKSNHNAIVILSKLLEKFENVSKYIQTNDYEKVNMSNVHILFDELISEYPYVASNLGKNSDMVHNKNFENGIVKIQDGEENKLNANERESVKTILLQIIILVVKKI